MRIHAAIFDVDGVIWIRGGLATGAAGLFSDLSSSGFPFCFLTNDCSTSKLQRYSILADAGLAVTPSRLITAAEVTNRWLIASGVKTVQYLGSPSALDDLARELVVVRDGPVDAVVVGDLFANYERRLLDQAAAAVLSGAKLVALQRNKRWSDGESWYIDNGFWVAGLEYATDTKAIVIGKPHSTAYADALRMLHRPELAPNQVAVVSDDAESDLKGAKEDGFVTVHFGHAAYSSRWVDHHVESMFQLRSLFGGSFNV